MKLVLRVQPNFSSDQISLRAAAVQLGLEVATLADRRAGKGPYVPDEGGGKQPRSRNKDGTWRGKRSDAGKKRDGNEPKK
jgi:hypothetical protein